MEEGLLALPDAVLSKVIQKVVVMKVCVQPLSLSAWLQRLFLSLDPQSGKDVFDNALGNLLC